jgi:hypothetical protein
MAKNRHQRRAAEKVEQTITVPHHRASDYREFHCDGALMRMDATYVTLTHFINDASTTSERMELQSQTAGLATYKPIGVDEKRFRTDVCAIRMPLATLQEILTLYSTQLALVQKAFAEANSTPTEEE